MSQVKQCDYWLYLKAAMGKRVLTLMLLNITNACKCNLQPTSTHIAETKAILLRIVPSKKLMYLCSYV